MSTITIGGSKMEARVIYDTPLSEVPRIKLDGDVDLYTVSLLKETVQNLMDKGHSDIVIDLENVIYMDSTGLGAIVGIYRRMKEKKGKIYLICPNPQVGRVFHSTGLSQIFFFYENEADFVKKIEEQKEKEPENL
ncbi:MAG: STAS domain-containing protein [Candidatus Eremiobacteraeota bacterium]|nr:STAS domain-containing protein [Candidatus Eremiobacteraeota bacterium]